MNTFLDNYTKRLKNLLDSIDLNDVKLIVQALEKTVENKSRVYVLGNGGSSATASHMANDLGKIFVFDPIPSHMRNYSSLADRLQADGSNIAGVLEGLEDGRKTEVQHILTHYLKGLPEREAQVLPQ